ncbi:MAG: GNAT family protein [Thermoleophilaceae bacterium]
MQPLQGERVLLQPLLAEHVPELQRIVATPGVLRWWGPQEPGWPLDEQDAESWTVRHDGRIVGLIQASEENEPRFRYAGIDIFLDSSAHGHGLGTDAVYTLARHLIRDRGHHRLVIDPAADNAVAIRCYEKVGFRRVGTLRSYERDNEGGGWHDGLLMDLLAHELPDRAPLGRSG